MSNETLLKIAEFGSLADGWCYGEGRPIKSDIQAQASELFFHLFSHGITKTDAFPGLIGEVRVTGYKDDHYLELTIESNDCVTFLYELNDDEVAYQEKLTLIQAKQKIKETIDTFQPCQFLYGQFIKDTGTNKNSDSKVWRLNHQAMAEFRYSVVDAQSILADAYAYIQQGIIKTSQTPPLFTGHSVNPYSRSITRLSKSPAIQGTPAIAI